MRTGLKRDVKGRTARKTACLRERSHLRMIFASALMPPLSNHLVVIYDDTTNSWIWSRGVKTSARKLQRTRHKLVITHKEERSTLLNFFNRILKIVHVLKITIHRCKSDVGDLVELGKLSHHQLSESSRLYLSLT